MSHASEWLEIEEELALKRARTSLLGFITYMRDDYRINWHNILLTHEFDDMVAGISPRLIISTPPQHGKTEIFSRYGPAYLFGHNPDEKIIGCSFGQEWASEINRDVQRIIDTDRYRKVFPHVSLSGSMIRSTAKGSYLRNSDVFEIVGHKGRYRGAGAGGPITGQTATTLLIDDLISNAEVANSPGQLQKHWEWYLSVARARMTKAGKIIVVMTRWSDADLCGRLIEAARTSPHNDQWKVINLPAENIDGPSKYDPRQPGELLWPEMHPWSNLMPQKLASTRNWQSLYQGDPVPPGGSIIQEKWWRYYDPNDLPHRFDEIVIAWDLSFLGNQGSDFTVGQAWGKKDGRAYLLRQFRDKVPFTRQVDAVVALRNAYPECRAVVVEQAANGAALIDALRPYIPNLVPMKPTSSKEARVAAITPIMEAGNVYIPDPRLTPWAQELVIECTRFPAGRHDDMVDSMTMALRRLFPNEAYTGPVRFVSMTRPNPTARL